VGALTDILHGIIAQTLGDPAQPRVIHVRTFPNAGRAAEMILLIMFTHRCKARPH